MADTVLDEPQAEQSPLKPSLMRSAFSLAEVIVVVAILGILTAIVLPQFIKKNEEEKKRRTQQVEPEIDFFNLHATNPEEVDLISIRRNGMVLDSSKDQDRCVVMFQNIVHGEFEIAVVEGKFLNDGDRSTFEPTRIVENKSGAFILQNCPHLRGDIQHHFTRTRDTLEIGNSEARTIKGYMKEIFTSPVFQGLLAEPRRRTPAVPTAALVQGRARA